jgi:BirA family biotin operon repressor/biotin-[acetyl-CoA-carboxylase] ligase
MENLDELYFGLGEDIGGAFDCVEYHDTLSSTQIRARELAGEGTGRALVVADEQTAGRGRVARHWESPKGCGLYFSVLFRPALPTGSAHMVNIAAALSAAKSVHSLLGLELELKWPNDLLILREREYRKVCGILSESAVRDGALDYCITGIGLNLFAPPDLPSELKDRAGWLCEYGDEIDRVTLLRRAVENFFDWVAVMEREGTRLILEEYRKRCASVGRVVRVETDSEILTGLCSGIGNDGELLVETPEGTRNFHVADVTHAKLE